MNRSRSEVVGQVAISGNRIPELQGHFPGRPVLPAVTMLNAMLEAASRLEKDWREMEIDTLITSRFRRVVTDRDEILYVKIKRVKGQGTHLFEGSAGIRNSASQEVEVATAKFTLCSSDVNRDPTD